MKRLLTIICLLLGATASADTLEFVRPPYLRIGDTVGLVTPAAKLAAKTDTALLRGRFASWGLHVKFAPHCCDQSDGYFAAPDSVRAALGLAPLEAHAPSEIVVPRPPALCQGCGHRDMYTVLTEVVREYPDAKVFGDIGCYTLGWLAPFHALDTVLDMGASITMAKGAADAGQHPAVAVIGDSTFTHSGMTGLLDAVNAKAHITVVISDNLTTGMTGGQDSAGTGRLERICEGLGVEPGHIRTVVPLPKNHDEMRAILREELEYPGVSVIIPPRECIQTAKRHNAKK